MDQRTVAEQQYQQGLQYAHSPRGEHQENLQRATACYETALQYYTAEDFPQKWQQIQADMAAAYSELVRERLKQSQETRALPQASAQPPRPRLTLQQRLLLGIVLIVILAIPTAAIATNYLARGGPACVRDTLNIDGSTVLQPMIEALAEDYMQHCSGAIITVGGGASRTGLADVEQGHDRLNGVKPKQDWGHAAGRDVPILIGASDIFASPVQHDLVDHQVAIGVFALILNKQVSGLHNLSTAQIQGIYTGLYQNWRQICDKGQCGPNLPIVPISRTVNSGTRFTFERYILKGVATVPGIGLYRTNASYDAAQEVENNPGSIGYAPLYLADHTSDVTILNIDGQDPHNASALQRNKYKFWNIEHMYTQGKGSALAQALINYMYSDVAKRLLPRFDLLDLAAISPAVRNQHVLETQ